METREELHLPAIRKLCHDEFLLLHMFFLNGIVYPLFDILHKSVTRNSED